MNRLDIQLFFQWVQHYVKYRKIPAETKCRCSKRRLNQRSFTDDDNNILGNLIDSSLQLYLDEISNELFWQTGKRWDDTKICQHMTTKLGYFLQVIILCAR